MKKILITYFGPFKAFKENPAELISAELMLLFRENQHIEFKRIEVTYESINHFLDSDLSGFDTIIELGVATKSEKLRLELFGTNYINGVDNNNHSKIGEIENTNTFSIHTKFPLSTIDQIISLYPDSVLKSESAGKYLCNFLYYKSIVKFPEKDILFIHLANFYDLAAALSAEIQVEIVAALIKYKSKNT